MNMGFKGLYTIIWLLQLAALAIIVMACITTPVTRLALATSGDTSYGIFGSCTSLLCYGVNETIEQQRVDGMDWLFADHVRETLYHSLLVTPIAAGFTLFALVLNFISQFGNASAHKPVFLGNFFFTIFACILTIGACILVILSFWPRLTWCGFLMIGAAALTSLCVPMTIGAYLLNIRDNNDGDTSSDYGRKGFLKQEELTRSFTISNPPRDSAGGTTDYYKMKDDLSAESTQTGFSEVYANTQVPQSYLISNHAASLSSAYKNPSGGDANATAPYPSTSSGLASTPRKEGSRVGMPYPTGGADLGTINDHQQQQQQLQGSTAAASNNQNYYGSSSNSLNHNHSTFSSTNPGQKSPYGMKSGSNQHYTAFPGAPTYGPLGYERKHYNTLSQSSSSYDFSPPLMGKLNSEGYNKESALSYTNTPIAVLGIPNSGVSKDHQAHLSTERRGVLPPSQEYDDEEFVRQNTIDPSSRPPLDGDDGIEDDRSDFTSVSQRAANRGYGGSHLSMLPGSSAIYDPRFNQSANFQQSLTAPHSAQYLGPYTPQQQSGSALYGTALGAPRLADASDMLLQNNPDFMISARPASTNTPKFGNRTSMSPGPALSLQGSHYKPAYKKRLQKTSAVTAASLSRDSPYGNR
ncbi:HGL205Wp [Eremothecium sinecaudum]|uniref:HGL205Wp n=1 Tax=Eremothecium sinecaudum TaxID=45286 RepID=A0A0X8HVA4_9SACH|nr:HGL205Wp [Eremothecium sinecaudum]AMD22135.1 HGL205Wp [Eremothecium sinecaudum]